MNSKILLVDDEPFILAVLNDILSGESYEIHTATSGKQAQDIMRNHCFKVVISDECMRGMQGSEFLFHVRKRYPNTIRILLTGHATLKTAMVAVNQGEIYRFFTKPCNVSELKLSVRSAIKKFDLESENRRLLSTLKRQSLEMKVLEQRFPGITKVEKDEQGNFALNDMPETVVWKMMNMCEREIKEEMGKD